MVLIGRIAERQALLAALEPDHEGALIVVGATGIGKTHLLESIADELNAPIVRISPHEASWPLSGLSIISAALCGEGNGVIEDLIVAARQRHLSNFNLAEQVLNIMRTGDETRSLIVDDIDRLDTASGEVVAYILRRLHGTRVTFVASATSLTASGAMMNLPQIALGPLDRSDAIALAKHAAPAGAHRGVLTLVATYCGGVPGAIAKMGLSRRELLGKAPIPLPLRIDFEDPSQLEFQADQSETAAEILHLVALAPFSSIRALSNGDEARSDALHDLIASGVVEDAGDHLRVGDPLIRSAILKNLSSQDRRRAHAQGAVLHEGIDARVALWHESFASDREGVGSELLALASRAVAKGEVSVAVEFAERALTLTMTDSDKCDLLLQLAGALTWQGEFTLAELYLDRMPVAAASAVHRLRKAAITIRIAHAMGEQIAEPEVMSLTDLHADAEPFECATLLLAVARYYLARWEMVEVVRWLERAAEADPQATTLTFRLIEHIARASGFGGARTALFGSLDLDRFDTATIASMPPSELTLLMRLMTMRERYEDARRIGAVIVNGGAAEPFWLETTLLLLGVNELRAGTRARARKAIAAWLAGRVAERTDDAVGLYLKANNADLDPSLSDEQTDEAVRDIITQAERAHYLGARSALLLVRGRVALAAGQFTEATQYILRSIASNGGTQDPSFSRAAPDLVEALWFAGRHNEARLERAKFELALTQWPSIWGERALDRLNAVCAPDNEAKAAFTAALRPTISSEERRRLRLARARKTPQVERTAATRGSQPVDDVIVVLDRSELEVAWLVHKGMRNSDIAAALFISQRTVELRLTNIYRKLSVRSRTQLVALLSGS